MTACAFCSGEVDGDGYCVECGLPADTAPRPAVSGSRMLRAADGLVSVPVPSGRDPSTRVISDPSRVRLNRRCRRGHVINFTYAGQPVVLRGFCPTCKTPFDFTPRLAPGELVADQYEVVGPIAHGGLGWVYVARDRHLNDNYVAMKGLIQPDDPVAVSLEVSERRFLISLDHPNIVRIYNFVTHDDSRGERGGYIVMEYLDGQSLGEILANRHTRPEPEHVLAYGYEILLALDYLHGRDLLYCDMKPDNVIITPDRVKVIDIGGVRRCDDPSGPVVGTPGFQVSTKERRERGLTVRSDIYAVGRTLEKLLGPGGTPRAGLAVESLRRLVQRAAHQDWERRFASAAEMLEQLRGVLREVRAFRPEHVPPVFEPSTVFDPGADLLDGGLSAVPPLERWTRGLRGALPGLPPPSALVARGLPVPRIDPDDPEAGPLASIGTTTARGLLDQLSEVRPSPEVALRRFRAHLELDELDEAETCLSGDGWRVTWHRGLLALAREEYGTALSCFDRVYGALPGETAPKLARAFCQEHLDDLRAAEEGFDVVWRRDRSQTNAAFGLARLRVRAGDRPGAVAILNEVPRVAQHHDAARVATVRVLSEELPGGNAPDGEDLARAARLLASLVLDGGEPTGKVRDRLTTAVREARLCVEPGDEARRELERSYLALANQATTWQDRGRLVDLAHSVHPWSLL
ncbi:serine/threonine-protein kinase [Streptosporangium saharense]|uniref:non-specific serine/threonine protein kinase n=1 Tax=Streptosporangium saharense TaxID=1706840 RepID=A0A7W7QP11_9ACTN|nr:serine/threonine-protein kinase [Streptosporangium saharense]MBB4917003.1 serine/threonine-protein kinase PknG [Streptosporangium saharense]